MIYPTQINSLGSSPIKYKNKSKGVYLILNWRLCVAAHAHEKKKDRMKTIACLPSLHQWNWLNGHNCWNLLFSQKYDKLKQYFD